MRLKTFLSVFLIVSFSGALFFYLYICCSISPVKENVETSDGIFTLGPELSAPRTESAGVTVGDKFYIGGGLNSIGKTLSDFYVYDGVTDKWKELKNLPFPVNHEGVTTDGKYIYLVGGFAPLSIRIHGFMLANWVPYDMLYRYDPANNTWMQLSKMPEARGAGGIAYGEGKIWYTGGINPNKKISASLFSYSIKEDKWEILTPMKHARDHMRMEYHKGNLYAISGREDDLRYNLEYLERYNIEKKEWLTLEPIPTPRGGFSSIVYNDKIYTFGGENVWSCYDKIEVYDINSGKWSVLAGLPEARHGIISGNINGSIHLISGGKHTRLSVSGLHRIYKPKIL